MALSDCFSLPNLRLTVTLAAAAVMSPVIARGQTLLRDDFAGIGLVDTTVWRLPFEEEGREVGRTLYRNDSAIDIPLQGMFEPLASDQRVMEIQLDTYFSGNPGTQFLGTDLLTKRNFALGGGITFEGRMRLKPPTTGDLPGGLVNGLFMFDVQGDDPPGSANFVRDEIDVELLSNEVAGDNRVYTNYWNNGTFSGAGSEGSGAFTSPLGIDLTQFQTYRVEWTPSSIEWFVNDASVRRVTDNVPDDPMKLHVNLWAPDSGFSEAFNAALQPAATAGGNQRFTVQVDHVEVSRFDTNVSENLLVDPSFEDMSVISDDGAIGGWRLFNNANIVAEDPDGNVPQVPDEAFDGVNMLSTFGPFAAMSDASGAFQNVEAEPGQQFEASVVAQTLFGDTILGQDNFALLSIAFLDDAGNVLKEEFGSPEELVDANGQSAPLLDGRDPNLFEVEDTWVAGTVDAVAPAGTALARVNLLFVQLDDDGGSVWFDAASLVRLDPILQLLPADFDKNGAVDGNDFLIWQANFGMSGTSNTGDANGNGVVDGNDFLIWQASFGSAAGEAGNAIPEPTTGGLLLLSLAAFAVRRSR